MNWLKDELEQQRLHCEALIAMNKDNTPMEIGDKVIPWDGSSLTDIDGVKYYVVHEPFVSTKYWIVISNNETTVYEIFTLKFKQDLIIVHPTTKQQFRISSSHVRHLNNSKVINNK